MWEPLANNAMDLKEEGDKHRVLDPAFVVEALMNMRQAWEGFHDTGVSLSLTKLLDASITC